MKILLPVDASSAALAPLPHLEALARAGVALEVLVINAQPRFHRHLSDHTSRASRQAFRQERSRAAMAGAIEALSRAQVRFRAFAETGRPAQRIAAIAEREQVDEVMLGVGRHPQWLRWINPSIAQAVMELTDIPVTVFARGRTSAFQRYAVPAGIAGIAALLLTAE